MRRSGQFEFAVSFTSAGKAGMIGHAQEPQKDVFGPPVGGFPRKEAAAQKEIGAA
jgi:hypothetical protein